MRFLLYPPALSLVRGRMLPAALLLFLWTISCASPQRSSTFAEVKRSRPIDVQEVAKFKADAESSSGTPTSSLVQLWPVLSPQPRGEFETKEQYAARNRFPGPEALYRFEIAQEVVPLGGFTTKYDIDHQMMTVVFLMFPRYCGREDSKAFQGPGLDLESKTTSTVKDGSNAFGAKGSFIETTGDKYGVVIRNLRDFFDINRESIAGEREKYGFTLRFPCDAETARRLKQDLRARVGVTFVGSDRVANDFTYSAATFKQPYATKITNHFAYVDLREVVMVDKATGKVLLALAAPPLN